MLLGVDEECALLLEGQPCAQLRGDESTTKVKVPRDLFNVKSTCHVNLDYKAKALGICSKKYI